MAVKNLAWLTLLGAMAVVGCSGGGSNNSTAGLAPNKSAEQTKQEADLTDAEMSDPHAMETLKKLPDARLVGKYQVQIDETVIPAQAKRDPQYPEKLAKLQRESPTI